MTYYEIVISQFKIYCEAHFIVSELKWHDGNTTLKSLYQVKLNETKVTIVIISIVIYTNIFVSNELSNFETLFSMSPHLLADQ